MKPWIPIIFSISLPLLFKIRGMGFGILERDNQAILIYLEANNNRTKNQKWSFQSDYILPLSTSEKHGLESGVKAILRDVSSIYDVAASQENQPDLLIPIATRTDQFDYSQNVMAAYSQIKLKWNSGWALHAVARMEGTFLEGNQTNILINFKNEFWNFVHGGKSFYRYISQNEIVRSSAFTQLGIW